MRLTSPICIWRWLWWSIKSLLVAGYPTSGHLLQEYQEKTVRMHFARCVECGREYESWEEIA